MTHRVSGERMVGNRDWANRKAGGTNCLPAAMILRRDYLASARFQAITSSRICESFIPGFLPMVP